MAQDREKLTPGNFWGDPDNEYEKINRNADRNNALDSDFRSHLTTNTAHNSSDIDDNSGETTGKVTDAIQSLRSSIDSITTADSNADIGVYSIADNSNTNNYEGTVTGLSYFSGLKVNLLTANQNTASSTLNLNSLGAKSIKVLDTKGNKHDLTGKEIYGISQLEYDGTDFILINGTYADYTPAIYNTSSIFSAGYGTDVNGDVLDYRSSIKKGQVNVVLRGNTRTNLVPLFDSGEWNLSGNTTIDSPTKISHSPSSTSEINVVLLDVKDNTDYTISVNHNSEISIQNSDSSAFIKSWTTSQEVTFNTGSNTVIKIVLGIDVIEPKYFENVMLEEGTEVKPFITGTKSTLSTRLKSVGKNLFDKSEYSRSSIDTITGQDNFDDSRLSTDFIKAKTNTTYRASGNGDRNIFYFYDSNKNYIGFESSLSTTTPLNCSYIRFYATQDGNVESILKTLMIEEDKGQTLGIYETYTESISYIQLPEDEELRSLPNGTKDEVKEGKLYKRTVKVIIKQEDVGEFLFTERDNYIHCSIETIDFQNDVFGDRKDEIEGVIEIYGCQEDAFSTINQTIGSFSTREGAYGNYIYFALPLGTTLQEAKQQLAGKTLIHQSAEPITYDLNITPLMAYEDGTIIIEPYIKRPFVYDSGITLPHPVSDIDKIEDILGNTIDDSQISLSSDGLTVTITGASNNQSYTVYAPIRPEESTIPTSITTYTSNTDAQIEGLNKTVNTQSVILNKHDSMLLGLALSYIDLEVRVTALEP